MNEVLDEWHGTALHVWLDGSIDGIDGEDEWTGKMDGCFVVWRHTRMDN